MITIRKIICITITPSGNRIKSRLSCLELIADGMNFVNY
jgi:hypothetical protein